MYKYVENRKKFQEGFHSMSLTFFLHLDLEALFEPARLALVPPRHVHDALAALLAHVVQVPATKRDPFNHSDLALHQVKRRRNLTATNPRERGDGEAANKLNQRGTRIPMCCGPLREDN